MLTFVLVLLLGVLPAFTVTIGDPSTSSPIGIVERSVNFHAGDTTSYNTSASDPQISADVGTAGSSPLEPHSGNSFLLITFDDATPSSFAAVKRQASSARVYNVTQAFSAAAGTSCTLNAYASNAQNGGTPPDCSITICGENDGGAAVPLTTTYTQYDYTYSASTSTPLAIATFSMQCRTAAYIALDDILIVANGPSCQATATVTQYITQTQTRDAVTITQIQSQNAITITQTRSAITITQIQTRSAPMISQTQITTLQLTTSLPAATQYQTLTLPTMTVDGITAVNIVANTTITATAYVTGSNHCNDALYTANNGRVFQPDCAVYGYANGGGAYVTASNGQQCAEACTGNCAIADW